MVVKKLFKQFKLLEPDWFFYVLAIFSVLPVYLLFAGWNQIIWIVFVPYFLMLMYYHDRLRKCLRYSFLYSLFISWFGFQWALDSKLTTFAIITVIIVAFFAILTVTFNLLFRLLFYLRGQKKLGWKKYILEFLMVSLIPVIWLALIKFIAWKNVDGDFLFKYGLFISNTGWVSQVLGLEGITFLLILFGSILILLFLNTFYENKHFKKHLKKWFLLVNLKNKFHLSKAFNKVALVLLVVIFLLINSNLALQHFEDNSDKTEIKVGVIQPNFNQSFNWRKGHTASELLPKNFELTKKAVEQGAQIVVWPESSVPYDIIEHRKDFLNEIESFAEDNEVNLVIGTMKSWGETSHTIAYINSEGDLVGNYVSSWLSFFSNKIVPDHKVELFNFEIDGKNVSIGSVLCYEEFYSKISSEMKSIGADFLVVTSNNQHVPKGLDVASYFSLHRAAETRLPLVRAANTGISQIVNSNGKVIQKLPPNKEGVLVETIWI